MLFRSQTRLLRALQEGTIERLGGGRTITVDVRIIAATNRDLQLEVAQGRFRADLMFRLDVLPLHISPLRERKEDVLPLARRFVAKYAPQEAGEELFTSDACRALLQHDWPGNARELENTVQRALVLRNGLFIQPQDLGLAAPAQAEVRTERLPLPNAETGKAALRASGKWAEYQHVIDTIRKFDGHKTKAAASLGMTSRALRYRLNAMREQGIEPKKFVMFTDGYPCGHWCPPGDEDYCDTIFVVHGNDKIVAPFGQTAHYDQAAKLNG